MQEYSPNKSQYSKQQMYGYNHRQDAQLSQRDRAAGCVTVLAKSRRLELGDDILQTL